MKRFIYALFVFGLFSSLSVEARDLTYKFGLGYRQVYSNAIVDDAGGVTSGQHNGLELTYGIANYFQVGGFLGFTGNFSSSLAGGTLRYDIHNLISRSPMVWQHVNLYVQGGFFAKLGKDIKEGITIHAPYLGIEILPFKENHLAISTSAGLVIDFVEENQFGYTNSMWGDVGVKYYF